METIRLLFDLRWREWRNNEWGQSERRRLRHEQTWWGANETPDGVIRDDDWAKIELATVPKRFNAVLQALQFESTRGGSRLWVKDVITGTEYPMPGQALEKMILNVEPQGVGLWDGLWEIRKRGAHVGLHPILPEEVDVPKKTRRAKG